MWCYRREIMPVRVVEDAEALVVWVAPETPILRAVPVDGRELRDRPPSDRFTTPKHFVVVPWFGAGTLRIASPGHAHSSWLFRMPDRETFWGWYGNLESPLQRSEIGVHTIDHVLDVWLDAAGNVGWKDEDELEAIIALGRFTDEQALAIRAEGARVFAAMQRRDPPYDGAWLDWRPDPTWDVPQLPGEWTSLAGTPAVDLFPQYSS
ncbi:MAG: hypothetical protein QOF21_2170 [Actinomycetota bacterium]|jgi:hypothetical protein